MAALVALRRLQRDLGSLKRAGGENCSDCGTVPCREGIWSARNKEDGAGSARVTVSPGPGQWGWDLQLENHWSSD